MAKINKRKVLLIDPAFQKVFIRHMVGTALAIIAITNGAVFLFFYRFESILAEIGLPEDHLLYTMLNSQKDFMLWIALGLGIVTTVVLTFFGLYFSNRVAGPLYRLRKHLEIHSDKPEIPDLSFRKGDFFSDLPGLFNKAFKGRGPRG